MRSRKQRFGVAAAMTLTGGFLFAGPGAGCLSFVAESGLDAVDFCFVFDCQNGILGGTIDPCPEVVDATAGGFESVLSPPIGPVFVDCPNIARP